MAQPRASAGSGTRRRVPWRSKNIEAAIREQAQVAVLGLGLGELGMECSVRAPRCVDARGARPRRGMRRACEHGARIVRVRTIRLIAQG